MILTALIILSNCFLVYTVARDMSKELEDLNSRITDLEDKLN